MINIFGCRLRTLRLGDNFTQENLAKLLDVNRMAVVKWEKGISEPAISIARKISHIFQVNLDYLLGEDIFTSFLLMMTDRFSQAKKIQPQRNSEKIELSEWIIYCNNYIEAHEDTPNFEIKKHLDSLEKTEKKIGYVSGCEKIKLKFPDDYNSEIINFIVKSDYEVFALKQNYLPDMIENEVRRYKSALLGDTDSIFYNLFSAR